MRLVRHMRLRRYPQAGVATPRHAAWVNEPARRHRASTVSGQQAAHASAKVVVAPAGLQTLKMIDALLLVTPGPAPKMPLARSPLA
jgi:hypothetical protein